MISLLQKLLTTTINSKMFENPNCVTFARKDLKNILDNGNMYPY